MYVKGRAFANSTGNYTQLYEPAGNVAIYLGSGSDPNNYYDNTQHYFRSRAGGSTYAIINSTGANIYGSGDTGYLDVIVNGGPTVANISANGTAIAGYGILDLYDAGTGLIRLNAGGDSYINVGNFGIGNPSPSYKLDVTGDARINTGALGVNVAPNATDGRIDASNDIVAYSSDRRLKTNIHIIENPLEKINKLTGFTYNWNEKAKELANYDTKEKLVGVFAQEVQETLPEAVKLAPFDNDGNNKSISGENYLTVQYEKIVPLLIEAIKEQQKQIDELKALIKL